ncbi:MAG TPA: TIGR01777 family oxidoreductase [Chthoniobacterales bacterium]
MHIGITGASGFLGREIIRQAGEQGHAVTAYSRRPETPVAGAARTVAFGSDLTFDGIETVIHLAGESIMGVWTTQKKARILDSRIHGTRRVVEAMTRTVPKPRVLISASGVAIYGSRGEEILTEEAAIGPGGFLREVAVAWEQEAARAGAAGIRVVSVRVGMVLGQGGGALPLLARVFGLGLGGPLGTGRQWLPWVHVRDVAALFLHAATHDGVNGPLNGTAPSPVRNVEFTRTLGQVLHRPTVLPAPEFLLRPLLREQASLVLDSQRVVPAKALSTGFTFRYAELRPALEEGVGVEERVGVSA